MEVVNLAAKNGVHVLCDKPIATNLQDANKMLQYIYAVKYGKIPIIEGVDTSWFFDYDKAGAGGFGDIGIHAIDALRWLSGGEAKKVYANG
ncbi:MAG: Gfo/Idh/MocA family oxidoreductase [Methanosarcinales archaeon]